jgi:hypothetical protein
MGTVTACGVRALTSALCPAMRSGVIEVGDLGAYEIRRVRILSFID